MLRRAPRILVMCAIALAALWSHAQAPEARAAGDQAGDYQAIKAFALGGTAVDVTNFVLTREQARMTFTGTFYLSAPVAGHATGAVFIGQGAFQPIRPPPSTKQTTSAACSTRTSSNPTSTRRCCG